MDEWIFTTNLLKASKNLTGSDVRKKRQRRCIRVCVHSTNSYTPLHTVQTTHIPFDWQNCSRQSVVRDKTLEHRSHCRSNVEVKLCHRAVFHVVFFFCVTSHFFRNSHILYIDEFGQIRFQNKLVRPRPN